MLLDYFTMYLNSFLNQKDRNNQKSLAIDYVSKGNYKNHLWCVNTPNRRKQFQEDHPEIWILRLHSQPAVFAGGPGGAEDCARAGAIVVNVRYNPTKPSV